MDDSIIAYIETSFHKMRQLRNSEKGEVWLATDASGKLVVIKRIMLSGLPYKMLKAHPQSLCPRVLYCAEDEEETLVVEEFVQGESLLERLEESRYLTEQEAKDILLRLCDGLLPLHKQGIIHRDIKPSNLILQNGGIIRLIDFDAARTVKEEQREDTRLLGTKGYAPPEQFGYGQTDARSDIYSIGITMQKMLEPAYRGYLCTILAKCTEIDPKQRYASVRELKRAILWGSKKRLWKAMAVLIACVIGVLCFFTLKFSWMPEVVNNTVDEKSTIMEESETNLPRPDLPVISSDPGKSSRQDATNEIDSRSPEQNFSKTSETTPVTENPRQQETVASDSVSSNLVDTGFYVNGIVLDQVSSSEIKADRTAWENFTANLHVENNTNILWEYPSVRIVFRDNWGGKSTETKSLPSLPPGASSDFAISVGSYPVPSQSRTSVWLQVYLDTGSLPSAESYWCVQFLLQENETKIQDDSKS